MTINRFLGRTASISLAAVLGFAACTSLPSREPNAVSSYVTPSARELFLTGKFMVKKSATKFLDEDHYGQELDLSERRPAVDLRGTIFEQKYGRPGTRLFGNFYHVGRFYIARVPDRAVKNVYFQIWYFSPKIFGRYAAAHSLLRFELNQPIELVALMPTIEELAAKTIPEPLEGDEYRVKNVIISGEAQWTKNDKYKKYSLKRGSLGAYTQIVRFASMQTRFENFYSNGSPVTQVKFDLKDPSSGDAILAEGLRTSESDGLSKLYDTLWYNCTTLAFDVVERAVGLKDKRLGFIRSFMGKRLPVFSPSKLESYGGIEAEPMILDPSLLDESEEAYQDKIAIPKRAVCPDGLEEDNCEQLKAAVDALKSAGRI